MVFNCALLICGIIRVMFTGNGPGFVSTFPFYFRDHYVLFAITFLHCLRYLHFERHSAVWTRGGSQLSDGRILSASQQGDVTVYCIWYGSGREQTWVFHECGASVQGVQRRIKPALSLKNYRTISRIKHGLSLKGGIPGTVRNSSGLWSN